MRFSLKLIDVPVHDIHIHSLGNDQPCAADMNNWLTGSHVIIAKTVKGKGVPMLEGHGPWHHRIPNQKEYKEIMESLA